jgi:hypothetical protein
MRLSLVYMPSLWSERLLYDFAHRFTSESFKALEK